MHPTTPQDPETIVERASESAQRDERKRTAGSAKRAAIARVAKLQRRRGVGRFFYENGLTIAMLALFAASFVGQVIAGERNYNEEQRDHGQPAVSLSAYLRTGAFLEATAENWESEFLQMGVFVLLTAFLYQRGSSESKRIEEPEPVDQDPAEARDDEEAPWPVRHGGLPLALYKYSLSLALLSLFLVSLALHAVGGSIEYNEEQHLHGGQPVTVAGYLATSRFWFESFQNWQSEFFSVALLVLFSIWLRQYRSAQSKPVAAPASDTGE